VNKPITDIAPLTFEGTGIIFKGSVRAQKEDYVAKAEMYIDGALAEAVNLPASYIKRRNDLFWKYQLPKGEHTVTFKWLNPAEGASINFGEALVYSDTPQSTKHPLIQPVP
jgi:hypothetical protein